MNSFKSACLLAVSHSRASRLSPNFENLRAVAATLQTQYISVLKNIWILPTYMQLIQHYKCNITTKVNKAIFAIN
jgi:hypothetical protein